MADPLYRIDGPVVPDLTPGLAMLTAARNANRTHERADKYAEMQALAMDRTYERDSHEESRKRDAEERKRAIEAWTAMPTLMRAAQKSTGMANMNPYGVKFDETRDLPANVEGPELSAEASAARYAPKPTAPAQSPIQPVAQPPQGSLLAGEEGPELDPDAELARHTLEGPQMQPSGYQGGGMDAFGDVERQRAADNMDAVGSGLQGPRMVSLMDDPTLNEPITADVPRSTSRFQGAQVAGDVPLMARAAANTMNMEPGPEGKRRLFASYGGNRFEVPEQQDTTGLGAKYDAIYQRFLQEPGVTPEEALKAVTKMAHEDSVESGRNQRLIDAEAGRDRRFEGYHMNVDQQFDALNKRLAMQEKTARINASARVATAGTASVPAEVMAALSKYATEHPGDNEGLYGIAKAANIADPAKAVTAATSQLKSTEGQKDDALNARKGLRAAEAMKMSGYTPTREDTQKWLNNQRWVYASKKDGLTGLFVLGGQTLGALPQSEVEGLSPAGQDYFANVRRLMEPLGRAASGAAISEGEWVNFFNQYGPNSRGGLDAARRDLSDMYKLSGSAGRSLGEAPGGATAPRWIPIPASLAGNPKLKGKTQIQVDPQGNVLGAK